MKLLPPIARRALRAAYNQFRIISVFANWRDYNKACMLRDDGTTILRTRSGCAIAVRHNKWDSKIIEEQFLCRYYLIGFKAPIGRRPVVIDIGGYIGDFTLYCAHELKARVVVYEPTAENWKMLTRNLDLNPHLETLVTAVNKGVAALPEVVANVVVHGQEVHASESFYGSEPDVQQRTFPCETLTEILDKHRLTRVDLLKIDCEGGEYDIVPSTPPDTFAKIDSLVLEWHKTPGWEEKLKGLEDTLRRNSYAVVRVRQLIYASRT